MIEKIFSSYRSVIFLDGEVHKSILPWINETAVVFAADGAANWMKQLKIEPDYIVGDGDSFSLRKGISKAEVFQIADQESTDFEKCINFAKSRELLPSLVLGVNGGEIDHILGNIQTLLKYSRNLSLFFLDTYVKNKKRGMKIGLPLSRGMFRLKVKKGATISMFPFCSACITTHGLIWDLNHQILTFNRRTSLRNRAAKEEVELYIETGKILVTIDLSLKKIDSADHLISSIT